MACLYVLKRSDNGLLQLGRGEDAAAQAARLSEGHAFDVTVAAVLPELGERHENVQWHLGMPPLKGNWHDCDLGIALSAVVAALGDESEEPAEVPAELEPELELEPEPPRLGDFLEPCGNKEATRATEALQAIAAKIGKEPAQQLLRGLRQATLPGEDGRKRRVWRDPEGRSLRLRA